MHKIILISTLLLSTMIFAEESISVSDIASKYTKHSKIKAQEELKQSLNFGVSGTSGNTETLNLYLKYNLSVITDGYHNKPLRVAFDTGAFFSENNKTKNNEEYTANAKLEQYISENWLGYSDLNWLRNPEFKKYNNKFSLGFGAGRVLYKNSKQSLLVKLGTSINSESYSTQQDSNSFIGLNEYLEYTNNLSKINSLYLQIGSMQNFDDIRYDYEVSGVAGVKFIVAENINFSLEEEVLYDNTPALGSINTTDTKTIVKLGYNF